jgi:hypothetical protein
VAASPAPLTDDQLLALIPDAAQRQDFMGAGEFARFVLAQYEEIFQTFDTRVWEEVSSPECEFCSRSLSDIAELRDSAGTREGGHMTLDPASGIALGGLRDDGFYYVGFHFDISAWTDKDSKGNVLGAGAAASGETALKLQFIDGHWVVFGIDTQVAK